MSNDTPHADFTAVLLTDLPDGGRVNSQHALVDAFDQTHTLTDGLRRHGAEKESRGARHHRGRALNTDTHMFDSSEGKDM